MPFETVGCHFYFGNRREADDLTFDKLSSILNTKVLMVRCLTVGCQKQSINTKGASFYKLLAHGGRKIIWRVNLPKTFITALCVLITSLQIAMAGKSTSKFICSNFVWCHRKTRSLGKE